MQNARCFFYTKISVAGPRPTGTAKRVEVTINTAGKGIVFMITDKIKELLGAELSAQVETALKGKCKDGKDVDLGISNDGSLVPASKYEEEKRLRAAAEETVKTQNKTIEDLSKVDEAALKNEIEKLRQDNQNTKANYEKQISDIKTDTALDSLIRNAGGKNTIAIKALIPNRETIKLKDDGSLEGIDLEAVKTSAPYLFDVKEERMEGNNPYQSQSNTNKQLSDMTYDEYKKYRSEN